MSIFGKIAGAILGEDSVLGKIVHKDKKEAGDAPVFRKDGPSGAGFGGGGGTGGGKVDVGQVLSQKASAKGQDLNYQSSIVDLMKLLDIDSSYENRKELAQEMGRTEYSGSAEDNIWLHGRVMEELEKHGGVVPASLKS